MIGGITRNGGTITFTGLIKPFGKYDLADSIGIGSNPHFTTTSFAMRSENSIQHGLTEWKH